MIESILSCVARCHSCLHDVHHDEEGIHHDKERIKIEYEETRICTSLFVILVPFVLLYHLTVWSYAHVFSETDQSNSWN